jgi:hypothetical protein
VLRGLGLRQSVEVRTFGAPRVGSAGFRSWCGTRASGVSILAYQTSSDLVPKIPLEMSPNWGQKVFIFKSTASPLAAHAMTEYIRAIEFLEAPAAP